MADKSKTSPQKELDKAQQQFDAFDNSIKEMTMDRLNATPKQEVEQQTKLSQKEINNSTDVYLKPHKSIGCRDKFNEDYREQYEYDKTYVKFIAENREIVGEVIDIWTRPYAGMPAEEWKVPVNKPVWGPRYLAEQIKRKYYHRLQMQENRVTSHDGMGQYYGSMVADTTIQRLDAHPVVEKSTVFMGARNF